MGKRIDELKGLDDSPHESPDPRETEWGRFSTYIDDLLSTGQYTWAERTLTDIQATVEKYERVTEGQRRAVENIEASLFKPRRRF